MSDVSKLLLDADDHWAEGRLRTARRLYGELSQGSSWHASFQTAWIDAAFGSVDDERLAALGCKELPKSARDLLDILVDRVRDRESNEILTGSPSDWDIDVLRIKPTAQDHRWWEHCGDQAIATGQWGLAEACFDEAAELMPRLYYDPPARVQGLLTQIEGHLDIVRFTQTNRL